VWNQIQDLKSETEEIDYDVNLDFTYEEIEELVGSEGGGAVGTFLREQEGSDREIRVRDSGARLRSQDRPTES